MTPPRILLCYLCVSHGPISADFASRFVSTYHAFPPGFEHDTLIICNGGLPKPELGLVFSSLKAGLWPHENDGGMDISAYLDCSRGPGKDYDMMLCLGESNYFWKAGWLARIVHAWMTWGPGMYGPFSSNSVRPHLQTTAFCCPPKLLREWPTRVTSKAERYAFEHGAKSFWRRVRDHHGFPVRLVTWDGEWAPHMWRLPPNILWRGNQTNCLWWANHTDRYAAQKEAIQRRWAASADRPFK